LEAIHKLMYESFHVDEPMTKHLRLNQGPGTFKDGDAMVDHLVTHFNLSILASDRCLLPVWILSFARSQQFCLNHRLEVKKYSREWKPKSCLT